MSVQTSYSRNPVAAFAGMLGDGRDPVTSSRLNGESANVPAGIFMAQGAEGKAQLTAAAADRLAGIVLNTFSRNPGDMALSLAGTDAYGPKMLMPMLEQGSAWVVCEQTMAVTDKVYVRFLANGAGKLQLGAVRKDLDGVAQVTTITPTAVNSTEYSLRVQLSNGQTYTFSMVSDATATAAEIVTGLRAAMAADAAFTAAVVATGSTTVILTGQVAGDAFTVSEVSDGVLAVAATTPPVAHARLVKGARVDAASTAAAGVVKLVFDLPTEIAQQTSAP